MKYIGKKLLMWVVASIFLIGCTRKELIELSPEFSLDAMVNPSSFEQVEQVLLSAYAGFRGANYYGSASGTGNGWGMMNDVLSDNLFETTESLANSRTMADWIYEATTGQVAGMYAVPYTIISRVNIVLRDIDKFTTTENQKAANRIKAQAYAIRAMAHFDLLRYFATGYDRNSTSILAVPYVTEFAVSTSVKPARLNNKDFYDLLLEDLGKAATLVGDIDKAINSSSANTRPFLDEAGIAAIQARVYLYAGMYSEAVTAATRAINLRPIVDLDQTAFSNMYTESNAGEIIWNVQFDANQSGPTFLVYFVTSGQRCYFLPAYEVAVPDGDQGLIQDNDIRFDAYFTDLGGKLAVSKYQGKAGSMASGNTNFLVFRTGEMYLIRAEAHARAATPNLTAALADLNDLRAARINGYTPVSGLNATQILAAVADERRRELFAEGHRFFDLKRTTKVITRGSTCGDIAVSPAGNCSLPSSAREWTLPIPADAISANGNLIQNPGY